MRAFQVEQVRSDVHQPHQSNYVSLGRHSIACTSHPIGAWDFGDRSKCCLHVRGRNEPIGNNQLVGSSVAPVHRRHRQHLHP